MGAEAPWLECICRNLLAEQCLTLRKRQVFLWGLNYFEWAAQLPNKLAVAPLLHGMSHHKVRSFCCQRSQVTHFSRCPNGVPLSSHRLAARVQSGTSAERS